MTDYDVLAYGAVADGRSDDASAIQRAIDACAAAGGGRVVIPANAKVRAGFFELKSQIDFHVAEGAILLSATAIEAFPRQVFGIGLEAEKRLWIGCRHAQQVTLSGRGTIDGQCHAFALEEKDYGFTKTLPWRPALTCFEDVRGLVVRDLTFRNAANWTLHFCGCQDVLVEDVGIFNDLKFPNADGIDPDHCQRVVIRRCHIVAADDCIVLKNTAPYARYGACEDIDISDCRLESVSSAFKIGSESVAPFRRVRMRDCVIERSNRGLAIQLRDQGSVEDIEFRNITVGTRRFAPMWWGAGELISITAVPRNPETTVGSIRNVRFIDIRGQGENGLVIFAAVPGGISDLHFERVHLGIERTTEWSSEQFDVRPCPIGYLVPGSTPLGEDTHCGRPFLRVPAAISIDGARDVRMDALTYSLPERDVRAWIPIRGAEAIIGAAPQAIAAAK